MTKEEYNARLQVFSNNLAIIRQNNADNEDFKLGVNKFADLSNDEFTKMMGFNEPKDDEKFL